MPEPVSLFEVIRGDLLESAHHGHAIVSDPSGPIEVWGDPGAVIYPRSSCKMIQALPLLESGAGADLPVDRLAMACASHSGGAVHRDEAARWLSDLGLSEADLRCGVQEPSDRPERDRLIREGEAPCQLHNNCSGKHSGFLMLNRHLGGGPEYHEIDHPVQKAVRSAFEEVTGMDSPHWAIDGCSAPNFATRIDALALAMARFAGATGRGDARDRAMARLRDAMAAEPLLVAGEGRACTGLMRAMDGVAVKTGAEAVYVAMIPSRRLGIAIKITDGGTRAAEGVIAALLVRHGALDRDAPIARKLMHGPMRNWNGIEVGHTRATL